MSLGRESDRPVNSSMRCNRCRTVLGWQKTFVAVSLAEPPASTQSPEGIEQDGVFLGRQLVQSP
jgi:hypothetical protein